MSKEKSVYVYKKLKSVCMNIEKLTLQGPSFSI